MGINKLRAHLKPLSRDVDVAAYAGCSVNDASAWLHRAYRDARADGAADVGRVAAFFADYAAAWRAATCAPSWSSTARAPRQRRSRARGARGRGSPAPSWPRPERHDRGGGATCVRRRRGRRGAAARARRGDVCVLTDDCDLVAMGAALLFAAGSRGGRRARRSSGPSSSCGRWARPGSWGGRGGVAFCVACGCDYAKNVPGVGPGALAPRAPRTPRSSAAVAPRPRCPEGPRGRSGGRLFATGGQ